MQYVIDSGLHHLPISWDHELDPETVKYIRVFASQSKHTHTIEKNDMNPIRSRHDNGLQSPVNALNRLIFATWFVQ